MTTMRRNKQINVRRALALAGTFSFLCSCARGCLLPFLTLYFRQLGLTPAMTGAVMGAKHLVTLVWRPAASLLSKHYNKRRAVITGSLVCSAAVALVLLLIPPADIRELSATCSTSDQSGARNQSVNDHRLLASSVQPMTALTGTHSETNMSAVSQPGVTAPANRLSPNQHDAVEESPKNLSAVVSNSSEVFQNSSHPATLQRNKRSKFSLYTEEQPEQGGFDFLSSLKAMDIQHQLFFLILISVSMWELASASLDWTADDGLYEYLDFADASDRYGGVRVWSLLGAACGAAGAGSLVSQLGCVVVGQNPRSAVHFFSYSAVVVLALPVAALLPLHLNRKRDRTGGLLKATQLVRASPRALLCAVTTLLAGAAGSAVENFLLWQMQDHGSSELQMAAALAVAPLSQAAFPLLAARVSRVLSPGRVLSVGAACLALQCFYYSFLWAPWAALPAQLLSCFSGGALWWAVAVQCDDVATPGAERSVGRVYSTLTLELGGGLGSVAGGLVVQRFGLEWLFRGVAVALMAWCVCLPLLQWKAPHQRRINYSRLLAADASEASESESEQERDWLDKAMEDDRSNNNNYGRRINH